VDTRLHALKVGQVYVVGWAEAQEGIPEELLLVKKEA